MASTHDDLSERQRSLLLFIEEYVEEYGRPPTNREIGNGMGIPSTGHVDYHLKALEKKGFISREQRTSRGIRVLSSLREGMLTEIPGFLKSIHVLGTIAAGKPLELADDTSDTLDDINPASFREGAFALRVQGNSMIEDGILDGDYVIIEPTTVPHTRDIIVATNLAAGEHGGATLKRFFQEGKQIRLQPANKEIDPIFVGAKEWNRNWKVQGRLAAVLRTYSGK